MRRELGAGEVKAVTDLRAQDRASSGMLRMMEQQAAAQRGAAGALSRTPPPKGIDPATWAAVTQQMSGKPKSK